MIAEICGLILTGGKSSRMGSDKAQMTYSNRPQWQEVADLLRPFCNNVYWSCTSEQKTHWQLGEFGLVDLIPGHGPASGLHAAFTSSDQCAWLVVGCDYPLLQSVDIQSLIAAREAGIEAIAYFNEQEKEIEPMIALWELQAQRNFLEAFSKGNDSPRRILRASKLKMIVPRKNEILTNRNVK